MWPNPHFASEDPMPPTHAGLGAADRLIWCEAIRLKLIQPDRVWWNLTVGHVPDWFADVHDAKRRAWIAKSYCKRPDVIWESNGVLILGEIKPYASYVAFGQAVQYRRQAIKLLDPDRPLVSAIITDLADPDLAIEHDLDQIRLIQIGERLVERSARLT